jgi:hypothetical protein
LVGDEVADGAVGRDPSSGPWTLGRPRWRNQPFGDETIDGSGLIERNEPGDRFTMIRDGHFLAIANGVQVAAEMISEFSYPGFHRTIVALSGKEI